jgi:hypothetical protein
MMKPTTHAGLIYQAFEVATFEESPTKHRAFKLEEPRQIMEAYDWCLEHFGNVCAADGYKSERDLQDQHLSWYFWGRRAMIRDEIQALEFRLRWC